MEFHVLGQVRVVVGGHAIALASRRQEQLLALLVCRRGRPVAAAALAEALWAEPPGPRSLKNLQVLVHRLRRSLGDAERIRHDRAGYVLAAREDEVDAWRFEALAARGRRALREGDPAAGTELLAQALALWRGPAFAGLDEPPALAEAAERLRQERRRALIDRIDADLALGREAELVPELAALLAEDPLAEPVAERLMVAMHRAGQRAGALEVYRGTRAALTEELGLEPGPRLRELHAAVLRGEEVAGPAPAAAEGAPADASPVAPTTAPGLLPAPVGDLTGRDEELRRVLHAVRDAARDPTGGPVVFVVSGMAGVGKTALAVRAGHDLREDFPDGQLYVNLRGAGDRPLGPGEVLGRFLRVLGVSGAALPDPPDERAEMFRARLAERRILLVLDDAADEAQVEPLIPAGEGCAVIVTSRFALTALPAAHRLALGVLDTEASVELLRRITGRAELHTSDGNALQLADLCGGLPLALRVAGARLAARAHWPVERLVSRLSAEQARLDELAHGTLSVRAGIALGYAGLAEPCRRLFRRLALVETPDFAAWVAAPLLDTDAREAEDLLELLLEAQLVEYAGLDVIGEPRYRLHDLVRLHARERLAQDESHGERTAAPTRLVGAYLALAEQAHRRQYGGDYTVLHGAGTRFHLGPGMPDRLLADPVAWLRSERLGLVAAVEQAARLELSEACWDLALTALLLFESQGHFDDWRHTSETALRAASRAGDRRGMAAMRYSLGTLEIFRQRYPAARPHFEAAMPLFRAVGDRHGLALTLRNAALIERVEDRTESALARYREALRMLREVGDRHAEAHVLGNIAQIHIDHDRPEEAGLLLETALGIYGTLGDRRGAAQIRNRLGALHLSQGRAAAARTAYQEVISASQAAGDRIGEAYGLLGAGEAAQLAGDRRHAADLFAAALALSIEIGEPFVTARAWLATGHLAVERRDRELAAKLLRQAARGFEELGLRAWHDRAASALSELGELGERDESRDACR